MDTMTKWIGGSFIIGAIFWAGVSYNRIAGIEQQLLEIKASLPTAGRIAVIETRMDQFQREIDVLKTDRRRQ